MKRIFTYLLTVFLLFAFTGNLAAVEKKEKKTVKKTVVKKTDKKNKSTKSSKSTKSKKATGSKKKYDTFVDKNKNGIDDRKEKLKKKTTPKKATKKKATKK